MQKNTADSQIEQFIETCRQHRLKITPQRVATYRALVLSKQHPTADLMYRTIKKSFPNISFDTVYRTLLTLAEIGVVDVVEVFGGPKRFDPDVGDHHHLHCMACGKIIDFEYDRYPNLDVPQAIAGQFKVTGKRVVVKGYCETCSRYQ